MHIVYWQRCWKIPAPSFGFMCMSSSPTSALRVSESPFEHRPRRRACGDSRFAAGHRAGSGTRSLARSNAATGITLRRRRRSPLPDLWRTTGLRKLPPHSPSATDQVNVPAEYSHRPSLITFDSEVTPPARRHGSTPSKSLSRQNNDTHPRRLTLNKPGTNSSRTTKARAIRPSF